MAFWRMLKEGNDQFLVSRQALKVDVCEKKYVFNANPVAGGRFDPTGPCPAFEVPQDIAAAAEQKRKADDAKVAALVAEGITPAPVKTGTDGGMHPVFLAAVKGIGDPSASDVIRTEPYRLPGTIPAHAVPPREPTAVAEQKPVEQKPVEQTQAKVATASASPSSGGASSGSASSGSWFSRLFGGGEPETTASASAAKATAEAVPSRPAQPASSQTASAVAAAPQPPARPAAAPTQQAAPAAAGYALASAPREAARPGAIPVAQPAQSQQVQAKPPQSGNPTALASAGATSQPAASAAPSGLLLGTAPVLSTSSFTR
jgi:hypothetical protein